MRKSAGIAAMMLLSGSIAFAAVGRFRMSNRGHNPLVPEDIIDKLKADPNVKVISADPGYLVVEADAAYLRKKYGNRHYITTANPTPGD
ncbi:MAG: hypothetical protein HY078_10010 [Elusimicrobia bacterium]|nr:hypothetical protein [Elusimicrobiota bacterium]